jgi:hypothetical protein
MIMNIFLLGLFASEGFFSIRTQDNKRRLVKSGQKKGERYGPHAAHSLKANLGMG